MQKKVEEVRIPSIRCPSIYHDPNKLMPYPEVTQLKLNAPPSVQVREWLTSSELLGKPHLSTLDVYFASLEHRPNRALSSGGEDDCREPLYGAHAPPPLGMQLRQSTIFDSPEFR